MTTQLLQSFLFFVVDVDVDVDVKKAKDLINVGRP